MSRFRKVAVAGLLLAGAGAACAQADRFPGIGRVATPAEVAAWDIDVRPDFKGLPPGSGSVAKGQDVWEAKCASCHGVFGESTHVFNPLVGGTTPDDVRTGRVKNLTDPAYPGRTTMMKLATVSSLWDYINRAMPWNAPKTLSVEEVYAVTAYMLSLANVVDEQFVLSDRNIADVQQRMPNRYGMSREHAMWPGRDFGGTGAPDVRPPRCMTNCAADVKLTSSLPEHARDAHGNLAEQNRLVGPQRGVATVRATAAAAAAAAQAPVAAAADTSQVAALLQKNTCTACHAGETQLVGPSWRDIARKHGGKADYLAGKIRSGGSGVWGAVPMPPQQLDESEARAIAAWLAQGARK
jgi:cytochrome c551/c552